MCARGIGYCGYLQAQKLLRFRKSVVFAFTGDVNSGVPGESRVCDQSFNPDLHPTWDAL